MTVNIQNAIDMNMAIYNTLMSSRMLLCPFLPVCTSVASKVSTIDVT